MEAKAINVIPMKKVQEQTFSPEHSPNDRRGGVSDPRRGENERMDAGSASSKNTVALGPALENVLYSITLQRDEINQKGRELIQSILTSKQVATGLLEYVRSSDSTNTFSRYAQGIDALLGHFDAGAAVKTGDLADKSASDNLAARFLRDQVKDALVNFELLIKRDDNTFRWASMDELQARHADLYPEKTATDLQVPCKSPANGLHKAAHAFANTCNWPFAALRGRQQGRRLANAKQSAWAKVHPDGSIEYLSRPFEGNLTEAEKKLLREAAYAEAEGKLKLKIAHAQNKTLLQQLQQSELDAQLEKSRVARDYLLAATEVRGRHAVRNAKLAGYLPYVFTLAIASGFYWLAVHQGQRQPLTLEMATLAPATTHASDPEDYPPVQGEMDQ